MLTPLELVGVLAAVVTVTAGACGRGPAISLFEPPPDPCDDDACVSVSSLQRAVDILFVIDNSGSMGVEQGTLAANFPAFIDVLEAQQFGASYRIGITTTDAGGTLRVTSCRERLFEFIFEDYAGGTYIDEQQAGCLASCAHDTIDTLPTEAAADGQSIPRPWIEKTAGVSNIAGGISIADAMRCAGPQGINGWGFEAPLESMYEVLEGNGNSKGFIRDEALLAVVFVTDETDCSMPAENAELLLDTTGMALWTDPTQVTSGVCWKAGTTCTGGPGIYDECHAVDKGLDGLPNATDPILYPVQRYVDALTELAAGKAARGGTGQVLVSVIGGVPLDYPETGVMIYQDSDDPEFNTEYGIGPSCGRGTETSTSPPGIPPVRVAEFAEQFAADERNLFSICSGDYTVALAQLVDGLGELSARTCVPGCVADYDDDEPGLQPECRLVERSGDGEERVVPRCNVDPNGWSFPGTSSQLCYRQLLDTDASTPTPQDDISRQCVTQGANVELVVERPPGVFEAPGTFVEVECDLTGPVGTPCADIVDG